MLCIRQTSLNSDNETGVELNDAPSSNDKILTLTEYDQQGEILYSIEIPLHDLMSHISYLKNH